MSSLTRKFCNAAPCRRMPFFRPASRGTSADEAFFRDEPGGHKAFKEWYDPKLHQPELTLLDAAGPADKEANLAFLGLNLGTAATAFAADPDLRAALARERRLG